ncbi:hypothetical protein TNCV_2953481 [Trichonephila clavipes]|nr:hypothetical protein TNCV_2953481 [Trichonephila clavipes]
MVPNVVGYLNSKVKDLAEINEMNAEEKDHKAGGNCSIETNNFRNGFAKVEQEATDLSGHSFEVEAGQAHRQQKRKIIFGESKKDGREFLNEWKISS